MKFAGLIAALCALGIQANAANAAEPATVKQYDFELRTLNLGETSRRGDLQFNIDNGMTEEELDSVKRVLDQLEATQVDKEGNRYLSTTNGTRVKIGGFLVEGYLEDSVEGVHALPVEFTVNGEFAAPEAALVMRIAAAGHLFIGSTADPDRVTTQARIGDKRFYRRHKHASITPDETSLAAWVRQNIAARDVPDAAR
jgi:hypothetical protein